ncbi:tetratricopeptide-like helical domain-containing protein [Artemisia annua]|uniref:Tetratricopeptide-like helical domain-containing protein n=1 Tax=Artemisia annua TaxID=35608 RepID=A0A2U1P1Z3_ARTAN|nr:tetratricopeptide-like helical domain-containing protein [Artemisia annua]
MYLISKGDQVVFDGYARVGRSEVSLELLSEMKESDVVPDRFVLSSALSTCSILGFVEEMVNWKPDAFACRTSVLTSCASLERSFDDARRVFNNVPDCNVIGYNAMIEGDSRHENLSEALDLFRETGLKTLTRAYIFAGCVLIYVYSKCSSTYTFDARLVFDEIPEKDIVVWNALLFGYTQVSENGTALKLSRTSTFMSKTGQTHLWH